MAARLSLRLIPACSRQAPLAENTCGNEKQRHQHQMVGAPRLFLYFIGTVFLLICPSLQHGVGRKSAGHHQKGEGHDHT
ncbi:MAG: hypothetical protein A2Z83_00660 [Omnitrophica bacterium GWA2_52_8]|nr:MAG: hypothetical protein A2Z83_00660 [Omnitrophica bacterium GWA2_52_8]